MKVPLVGLQGLEPPLSHSGRVMPPEVDAADAEVEAAAHRADLEDNLQASPEEHAAPSLEGAAS